MKSYAWPGNARELENVVERELILSKGGLPFFKKTSPRSRWTTPLQIQIMSTRK